MDIFLTYVFPVLTVFTAAIGFSLFHNVRKSSILFCCIGAALGCACYLIIFNYYQHKYVAFLVAAIVITIYSEIVAKVKNVPVTIFLSISLIPLVPGKPIFNTLESLLARDMHNFSAYATETFLTVLFLVLGVMIVSAFVETIMKFRNHNSSSR